MCCIELIKQNISSVQKESTNLSNSINTIDSFLDAVNEAKGSIEDITNILDKLTDSIWDSFDNLSKSDFQELDGLIYKIILSVNKTYKTIYESKLYPALKTVASEMRSSINNVIEVYQDLKYFKVDLPSNTEFQKLASDASML